MDEQENIERMNQHHDSICGSIMEQSQEYEQTKNARIADLRQRLMSLSNFKIQEEKRWN